MLRRLACNCTQIVGRFLSHKRLEVLIYYDNSHDLGPRELPTGRLIEVIVGSSICTSELAFGFTHRRRPPAGGPLRNLAIMDCRSINDVEAWRKVEREA
jgi:hypothetical protein